MVNLRKDHARASSSPIWYNRGMNDMDVVLEGKPRTKQTPSQRISVSISCAPLWYNQCKDREYPVLENKHRVTRLSFLRVSACNSASHPTNHGSQQFKQFTNAEVLQGVRPESMNMDNNVSELQRGYITVKELAVLTGYSRSRAYQLVKQGKVQSCQLFGKNGKILIPKDCIEHIGSGNPKYVKSNSPKRRRRRKNG